MKDRHKTKAQLITELRDMRRRIDELEKQNLLLKQTDITLQASDIRFKSLFDAMLEGVCLNELIYNDNKNAIDYRILDVNPRYEEKLGLKL